MKLKKVFLVFLFCVFLTGVYVKFLQFPPGLGLGEGKFPQKEITFLKKYGIDGNVYANQEISAFITWELSNSKIFVDTRDDLFEPVGVFQKLAHLDAGENLSSVLSAYHADIVIGSVGEGVVYKPLFYNENWKLVEMDGGYFILVKKETQVQKNLEIYESLDPLRVPPVKQGELEKGEQELAKLIEMGFDSAENKVRLIETKLTQGDGLQAKQLLLQLNLEENIGVMQPIYNIESSILKAKVALAAGDCEGVFRLLSKAENESRGKLFFIPKAVIPSNVDRYWGEYYFRCKNDTQKAREYYNQYMQNTSDPLENREIERKLKEL
jgi:hypothetical protein